MAGELGAGFDGLVIEGGSLKCAFTTAVLDTFLVHNFNPFKVALGNSSGSIALAFFLSGQRKHVLNVSREIVKDSRFISYRSAFSEQGLMNLEFLKRFTMRNYPLDEEAADRNSEGRDIRIVATDFETGRPIYLSPSKGKWVRYMMASSTLPLITRGKVKVDGRWMFDGGYSDGLPYKKAFELGASKVLVIRTRPAIERLEQSWGDHLATYWHRDNPGLVKTFEHSWHEYNDCADELMRTSSGDRQWLQIAPDKPLQSDGYFITPDDIMADYRHGLEKAQDFIVGQRG
jgi:predicted patatin/cPLA2 family phospholipase